MAEYAGLCAEGQDMLMRRGVDLRERWNAALPLVEDRASPHLDYYPAREGHSRGTPSLAQLVPPDPDPAA